MKFSIGSTKFIDIWVDLFSRSMEPSVDVVQLRRLTNLILIRLLVGWRVRLVLNHVSSLQLLELPILVRVSHHWVAVHLHVLLYLIELLLAFVVGIRLGGWNLVAWRIWRWNLPDPLFIFWKFQTLEHTWIHFFVQLGSLLIWLFHANVGAHSNQLLRRRLTLIQTTAHPYLLWLESAILLVSGLSIWRRRHQVVNLLSLLYQIWDWGSIRAHPVLDELVELIGWHVLELSVLSLAHKPYEYLLISVLLPLGVS